MGRYEYDTPEEAYEEVLRRIDRAQRDGAVKLDLSRLGLTAVPPEIEQLTGLQALHLSNNQLTAVPPEIGQLTGLQTLYLYDNQLTAVPPEIGQLTGLQTLYLVGNKITELPEWLVQMPQLEKLTIKDCPITQPPPEILGEALTTDPWWNAAVDLEAVRRYYAQLAKEGTAHIYEAKLLLIGEGGAGKTSLARKLRNPAAPLPAAAESTEGIDVVTWAFDMQDLRGFQNLAGLRCTANIWDFGGQEIYHATHQFFLTHRSLYILVADACEQKTDFDYWLHAAKTLGGNSPLLIVVNEKEGRTWHIDSGQLHELFGNLAGTLTVDLKTGVGLPHLTQTIQNHLARLPHIGDALPRTWVNVRRALEEMKEKGTPHITLREYLALCQQHGFSQLADKLQLSGYLHDLGVILHFQDDDVLQKTVILNPEWGTAAVYRILDNEQVVRKQGRFSRANLDAIWHEEAYALMRGDLLALMMKFQLCYEIPERAGRYIAPQLLGQKPPAYDWPEEENLILRYRAPDFMPKGIIARFIVAMHKHIEAQRVWRSGVVLADAYARAELIESYHQREITIRIVGNNQGSLLTRVTWELDKIFDSFHNLNYDKLIPCNCAECRGSQSPYFYKMASLKRRLSKNISTVECDHSYETVSVASLIENATGGALGADAQAIAERLRAQFNEPELRECCFKLGLDYDDLGGRGRTDKARELVLYMQRHGRLPELVACMEKR